MKLKELRNKMKDRLVITISAGMLCFSLVVTGVTCTVYAAKNNGESTETAEETEDSSSDSDAEDELDSLFSSSLTLSEKEIGKDESVYIITSADGDVEQTIVSDHLLNEDESDTLEDASDLTDIVNMKGDETYTQNGNSLTWAAGGNDIYYQGTTTKEAPVTQTVTYYLDGKEVSADQLAGASGTLTIHFDYTNNSTYTTTVNGKDYTVAVPFAALTALVLDDSAKNISVTNGKVENTSYGNIVVGYALPGLQESLGLDDSDLDEDIEIPNYFEVTADVEDFQLDICMTMVANAGNVVNGQAISLDNLDDALGELSDASVQLQDGSSELAEGMDTLESGLSEYLEGAAKVNSGINTLAGSTGALVTGANSLNSGAQTLNSAISELTSGLKTATGELATNYAKYAADAATAAGVDSYDPNASLENSTASQKAQADLITAISNLSKALAAYTTAADSAGLAAAQNFEAAVDQAYAAYGASSPYYSITQLNTATSGGLYNTLEQYSSVAKGGIVMGDSGAYEASASAISAALVANYGAAGMTEAAATTIANAYVQNALNTALSNSAVTACASAYQTAYANVTTAVTKFAKYYGSAGAANALYAVSSEMKAAGLTDEALDQLAAGSTQLSDGTASLVTKIPQLTDGISQLQTGSNQLVSNNAALLEGAQAASDGATELSDGILQFNEEGINKILDSYNGDIKDLTNRMNAVIEAANSYNAFTDAADGVNVNTKFIYKMDAISSDSDDEE